MRVYKGAWVSYALTAITSILITGTLGWFTLAGKAVTAAEVRTIVQTTSPYIEDRRAIEAAVDVLQNVDGYLDERVEALDERLRRIERSLARIEAKLE